MAVANPILETAGGKGDRNFPKMHFAKQRVIGFRMNNVFVVKATQA
jgi:hypothetical protein